MSKPTESKFFINLKHPFSSDKRKKARRKSRQEKFHRQGPQALQKLSRAIKSYPEPIAVWLEFGTLLGAYREHKLIEHDDDIDLGIAENDCTDDFLRWLETAGFALQRKFTLESDQPDLNGFVSEYTFTVNADVNVDLFVFRCTADGKLQSFAFDKEPGMSWKETVQKLGGLRTHTRILTYFGLQEMTFLGNQWKVPANLPLHLAELYGEDFMHPREYSYSDRPKDHERLLPETTLGIRTDY